METYFLSVAVLSLIAAVAIPIFMRKYEEGKSKFAFTSYVKGQLGVAFNIMSYDTIEYKKYIIPSDIETVSMTFKELLLRCNKDFSNNKNTIHPAVAFNVLLNFNTLLLTAYKLSAVLKDIDVANINEKTLQYGDKLSKKEHSRLTALTLLIKHYNSIVMYHDVFDDFHSIKRVKKANLWIGVSVDKNTLNNQSVIMTDMSYLVEKQANFNEIINTNLLLIQEFEKYFEYEKLLKKKLKK